MINAVVCIFLFLNFYNLKIDHLMSEVQKWLVNSLTVFYFVDMFWLSWWNLRVILALMLVNILVSAIFVY